MIISWIGPKEQPMMMRLVTDYLDESMKLFHDKIAFADDRREMLFKELYEESDLSE